MEPAGLSHDERVAVLDLLSQIRSRLITPDLVRKFDEEETFPEDIIRALLGPEIGLQLLFIPREYGGLGGGARDLALVSEELGKICLGISTGFLAVHLGTEPILVAGTEEQKRKWLSKVVEEGAIVAFAVTEPEAGSNLANLKTFATPVADANGQISGYRITGTKQFISNGGYADFVTVLAQTPDGPAFFVVEKGAKGFVAGKPEQKHGIRASNTAPLSLDDVFVPADHLVGEKPGRGLEQANQVFAFTRLMVGAFALGAGVSALQKACAYSKNRVQFGTPLVEKQGYTHKLLVPFLVDLEASRAYIEHVAARFDAGEQGLDAESAIAKLFATETSNACAESAIQALGGYGYIREYEVEKIKRDVRITTIYEGTSEIQQLIISTHRWRSAAQSKGGFYGAMAERLDTIHERNTNLKADVAASVIRLLNALFLALHETKLTRQQHLMFQLALLAASAETTAALIQKAADASDSAQVDYLALCARTSVARTAQKACAIAAEILHGSGRFTPSQAQEIMQASGFDLPASQEGLLADLDALRAYL
ncbi:MAG: acyl-CoA dehydrogenase family protein [Thermoleophilia bacterium]|nr:acyl-CoA dehydrogenase family protein [Thermoleophilia bacterium]